MATVVGLFDNRTQAQAAIEQLRAAGVDPANISIATRPVEGEQTTLETVDNTEAGSVGAGAVGGGILGGLAGFAVAALSLVTLPILGPLALAGPLAATLIGAGVGAAAGGLIGALVDLGVPEEEARLYQTGVERGGVLLTVHNVAAGGEEQVRSVMRAAGMRDIAEHAAMWDTNPDYRYTDTTTTSGAGTGASDAVGG